MSRENYNELASRIYLVRDVNHLSKAKFCKLLGFTSAYATNLESGKLKKISLPLAKLISKEFDFNEQWILEGTGPMYSTMTSPQAENVSALDIILRNIEKTDRVLEIIYGRHDTTGVKADYLARFTDGNYLLIGAMSSYNDEAPSFEIRDIRHELAERKIPLYRLKLDERWYADYTIYPKKEKLEALFFRPDIELVRTKEPWSMAEIRTQAPSSVEQMKDLHQELAAEEESITDLLRKTSDILRSNTIFRSALRSNINAFHYALQMAEQLAQMDKRIDDFEKQTQRKFHELAHLITNLQEENRILKESRSSEDGPTTGASSGTDRPSSGKTT